MATFHILNFGCRSSQADGAAIKQQLLAAGLEEAARLEKSEVAVLNTCTVTAAADAEVRQFVRRIRRQNPRCRILVTGCYAQRAPEEIARLEGVAWVVGNSHKHLVKTFLTPQRAAVQGGAAQSEDREIGGSNDQHAIERIHPTGATGLVQIETGLSRPGSYFDPRTSDCPQILVGKIAEEFHFAPVFPDDRTRPTLKLQDGCNARCSFCVIPRVRGRSRSLGPDRAVAEVRRLEEAGYKEVVLSGINLGSYGRDLDRRINFVGILERLLNETSIPRLRISSIELMDLSAPLIRLTAQEPRLARHFHIPLQSGCDRILRLMNRRYWSRQYAERILAVHEQIPNCGIGADVMVGFPGETEKDHAASLQFIESLPFTYLHVFPYSLRPGTRAATASGQVDGRVAHERSQQIRAVIARRRQSFLTAQVGRSLPAITLDETEAEARVALTSNYLKVTLAGSAVPANRLVEVMVDRVSSGCVFGRPLPEGNNRAARC